MTRSVATPVTPQTNNNIIIIIIGLRVTPTLVTSASLMCTCSDIRYTPHLRTILRYVWQGRLHKGEWCEMHHGENWGGECCDDNDAFARVYNNLLLHEYIYYFTPVHF